MRTNVTFRHPAEFVPLSDEDGILAAAGAQSFVGLLQRIPGLELDADLCQEDWGVVIFARLKHKQFWIGLSFWPEGQHAWLAHCHHSGWLQRFSSSGTRAFAQLVSGLHGVLASEPAVSNITWYEERQMTSANPEPFATPVDG